MYVCMYMGWRIEDCWEQIYFFQVLMGYLGIITDGIPR